MNSLYTEEDSSERDNYEHPRYQVPKTDFKPNLTPQSDINCLRQNDLGGDTILGKRIGISEPFSSLEDRLQPPGPVSMFFYTSLGPSRQDEPIANALIASGFGNTTSAPLGGRPYKNELLTASLLAEINRFPKSHGITTEEWLQLTAESRSLWSLAMQGNTRWR